jgi:hypothetical protein
MSLGLVEPSDEEAIGQWYQLRSTVVRADWPDYPPPCWIHEVKVANLDLARVQRPALRILETCNADSNRYMVRINEAMGFRPHHRAVAWQLEL